MTRADLAAWIAAYERTWRTAGTDSLCELFAADVTYRATPFVDPMTGLGEIASFWEAEREGPDEAFVLAAEIVAVDGDVGVARIDVDYGDPPHSSYRDIWIVTLDDDGRCTAFEEWPFFPGQAGVSPPGGSGP
jgi:ketosteroid isomerase-like protein